MLLNVPATRAPTNPRFHFLAIPTRSARPTDPPRVEADRACMDLAKETRLVNRLASI